MAKLYIATVVVCSAFAIGTLINPCQREYRSFRDTLQKHRREGRVLSNSTVSLPRQFVFTKMQCLEICLRNPLCDGFEMRQKVNNEKNMWACKIYRISNSSEKKQETNAGLKNWIHYNISSLELRKVSFKFSLRYPELCFSFRIICFNSLCPILLLFSSLPFAFFFWFFILYFSLRLPSAKKNIANHGYYWNVG